MFRATYNMRHFSVFTFRMKEKYELDDKRSTAFSISTEIANRDLVKQLNVNSTAELYLWSIDKNDEGDYSYFIVLTGEIKADVDLDIDDKSKIANIPFLDLVKPQLVFNEPLNDYYDLEFREEPYVLGSQEYFTEI